eukprot:TRINITY_DN9923_c0_g1_i1.p1 TRINITY_DN9923_c0_g1~~TRINITY_DN9923_c0_g1_i1.p1  ORF type:complete len:294 (+),score=15.73 TRINITY_DN9923_c0_g1_i1:121-1002(+)
MKDFAALLKSLPEGSYVAVVTMTGSCCPVTLGHIQGFIESRRILRSECREQYQSMEHFAEVLGLLSLNGDSHVANKMQASGVPHICFEDRSKLVEIACAEHDWLSLNPFPESMAVRSLVSAWSSIRFVHYRMNGADDVIKYEKWEYVTKAQRGIVMCRPGYTEELMEWLHRAKVDLSSGLFIVGPELPDISSTDVRKHLYSKNTDALAELLHREVMEWCLSRGPYRSRLSNSPAVSNSPAISESPAIPFLPAISKPAAISISPARRGGMPKRSGASPKRSAASLGRRGVSPKR